MQVGLDGWLAQHPVHNQRIGLLSHQAALTATGETSAQRLRRYFGDNLVALFAPEHGYFVAAAAGEKTPSITHPLWGIPVYSLYGETRKPTPAMLAGIDCVVVDLQDLGVRCYTYLATLKLMLEACQEAGVSVIVCDRPVPLPGCEDGPIAHPDYFSFVAPCALPMVYGKTQSEVAAWLGLPHQAAQMVDYTPSFRYPDDAPLFVPPSPAIRSWHAAQCYPALVFAEAFPSLDVHRGGAMAFQALSAPFIDGEALAGAFTELALPGVNCFDYTQGASAGGIRLAVTEPSLFKPIQVADALLALLDQLTPHDALYRDWRPAWLNQLYGCEKVTAAGCTAPILT